MDIITTHTTADRKEINEFVNQVCVLAEQKFQTGMRIAKVNIHGDIVIRGATTPERALWLAQLLAQFAKKHGKQVQFSISDILVDENGYVTDSEGYAVNVNDNKQHTPEATPEGNPEVTVIKNGKEVGVMSRSEAERLIAQGVYDGYEDLSDAPLTEDDFAIFGEAF